MNKMNTLSIIALILIFIGGVGAILLTIGQSISSSKDKNDIINTTKQENIELKNDLSELKLERHKLTNQLAERDKDLNYKNDTIISLYRKISEKSEYIQKYLTGGKGYPYIEMEKFAITDFNNITGMFNLHVISEFPMYNIRIKVYDYDKLELSTSKEKVNNKPIVLFKDFESSIILSTEISELTPPQSIYLNKKVKLEESRYYIQIHTRNNTYIEKMASIIHKEILSFGFQLFTLEGTLLKEDFGNAPNETKLLLINKLNTISLKQNFDLKQ